MTVNEFLQKYRRVKWDINVTRPRVCCADGYSVSIQAGWGIYSTPCKDADYYEAVELGFPSMIDEDLAAYYDGSICAFVPVDLVDKVLQKHGGIVKLDFSNTSGSWESENGGEEDGNTGNCDIQL